jgi:FixJ family two-component response regulator
MPGLNGIELKQRLDAMNSLIPVIMITARVEPRLHRLALASGAFCLLRKPFKSNALIDWVEKAFGQGA